MMKFTIVLAVIVAALACIADAEDATDSTVGSVVADRAVESFKCVVESVERLSNKMVVETKNLIDDGGQKVSTFLFGSD